MSASGAPAVVALSTDLMDRSRIAARYPDARFVRDAGALAAAARPLGEGDVVLVDLSRPDALSAVQSLAAARERQVVVVAYGSHVDADVLEAAAAAGATDVLARSVFFRRLSDGPAG